MSFCITYRGKLPITVTFFHLENKTVKDMKMHIAKHYELNVEDFCVLDLGRFMEDEELLSELERKTFTIYIRKAFILENS